MLDRFKRLFRRGQKESSAPYKRITPAFPSYICLETTNRCNLRCVHCLYRGGTTGHYRRKTGFIDVDLARRVLDQLQPYQSGVMLNGDGEALLHPHFHEIARHAVELGLPNVYFNTNGTLLKPEFTDRFVTYFKGAVSFSLDGFKESHERIRAGSSYERVVENIEYLQKRVRETNAPIKVNVAYCNYDQPETELAAFVKHWVERVDVVSVGEVYDKDYKIISEQINRQESRERRMCGVPWETFIVQWDGFVVPCSNCFSLETQGNFVLGDARRQSLEEIWHGEPLNKLRERTETWQLDGTVCEACERWNMYVVFGEKEEDGLLVSRTGVFTTYRKKGV
jgi:radical SAM protein with 4Fe4S-binding SPASM domain